MSLTASVRHRVDPVPLTALVAIGDLVCIALFVFGGAAGGHSLDPVGQFGRVAQTSLTFTVGWALAALVGGLYTADARRTPKQALVRTIPAWIVAALIAQVLRATSLFPGDAAVSFFLVSVAVGGVLLAGWRVGVAWVTGD